MYYSKLLIINNYSFNDYKGGGITLKNLFLGWPKDKIAIAHLDDSKPVEAVCEKYYKIGYSECHYVFPLNKFSTEPIGKLNGSYSMKDYETIFEVDHSQTVQLAVSTTNNKFKRKLQLYVDKIGILEFIHPINLSDELRLWITTYNPKIIYCQPENISFIRFALKVQKITNAKLVVHVMDDWPFLVYKNKILKSVLRIILKWKFSKLLKIASLRLGISKAMAEEFQIRYKLPFKYFHNPIDTSMTKGILKYDKPVKDSYLIVYSGRIGFTASHDSIIEFSKCIHEMRKDGLNISFNIYTDLTNTENDFSKFQIDGTNLLPALKDDNFITKLMEADILLYPVDFDKKSIDFIRLSFPTKLPSYLISGVPVFCFGPDNVYSMQFMKNNNLGFVCNDQRNEILKKELWDALTNNKMRTNYSEAAFSFAKNNFESSEVRASFHKELADC